MSLESCPKASDRLKQIRKFATEKRVPKSIIKEVHVNIFKIDFMGFSGRTGLIPMSAAAPPRGTTEKEECRGSIIKHEIKCKWEPGLSDRSGQAQA
jgi:hypothetical protein